MLYNYVYMNVCLKSILCSRSLMLSQNLTQVFWTWKISEVFGFFFCNMPDLYLKQYIKKATIKEMNYAVVIWVGFETGVTFYCNNFF